MVDARVEPLARARDVADPRRHLRAAGLNEVGRPDLPVVLLAGSSDRKVRDAIAEAARTGVMVLVILLEAQAVAYDPWALFDAGAGEVVTWEDERSATQVVDRLARWEKVEQLLNLDVVAQQLVGTSSAMRTALRRLVELAEFTRSSILITGESGTGKEAAARLVHAIRGESDPCEVVDCTTINESLAGSELWGHEKGAFTGAHSARAGAFANADGGTLFLDEVGELPLVLQAALLRVIQERQFKRLGSDLWRRSVFDLVSATNRDLAEMQRSGGFRSDLFHRIASAQVHLPPLRDRGDDILELFGCFVRRSLGERWDEGIAEPVRELLLQRDYPGNVRDLEQLSNRIAQRHLGSGPIVPGDVPPEDRPRSRLPLGVREVGAFEEATA